MGGAARRRVNRAAAAPATGGACAFCGSHEQDETTVGRLYVLDAITVHYYCALLSCGLVQHGSDEEGLFGFLLEDILAELQRGKKLKCSYCGTGGATVACCLSQCRKMFHLPCGRKRGSVSIFCGSYSSYCIMHAPMQPVPDSILTKAKQRKALARKSKSGAAPAGGNTGESGEDSMCAICYEEVEPWPSTTTFWPPCCARDRWLHVLCVQRMALSAGMHYLKCPLCNDKDTFQKAVAEHGVYIPDRDAAWELEEEAFAELYERPKSCSAEPCRCYQGREYDADQGRWELKLCLMCGSVAVHLGCLGGTRHVCAQCASVPHPDLDALESIPLTPPRDAESSAPEFRPLMSHRLSVRRTKPATTKPSSSSTLQADVWRQDRVVKIMKPQNDDDEPDIDVDIESADEPSCSNTQSDQHSARAMLEKPKYSIIKWLLENDILNPSPFDGRFLKLETDQTRTRTKYNRPSVTINTKAQPQNSNCLWKELIDKNTKKYEANDLVTKNNKYEVSGECTGLKIKEEKIWNNKMLNESQSNVPLNTKYLENGTNFNEAIERDNSLSTLLIDETVAINDVDKIPIDAVRFPKTSLTSNNGCDLPKSHKNEDFFNQNVDKLKTSEPVFLKKDGNVNTDNVIFSPKRSLRSDRSYNSPYNNVTDTDNSPISVENPTIEKIMIINNITENPQNEISERTLTDNSVNNEILCNSSCSNEAVLKDNQADEIINLTSLEMSVRKEQQSSESQKSRHDGKHEKVIDENSTITKALDKNLTTVKTLDKNSTKEEMPKLDNTPKKVLQKTMLNTLEDKILSPLKMIEQKIYAMLTDEDSGEFKLRIDQTVRNMKKPRPMSIKKKVIGDILEDLLEDCAAPSTAHIKELTDHEPAQNESAHKSPSDLTASFNETSKLTRTTPSKDNLDIAQQSSDEVLTIDLTSHYTRRISISSDNDETLNSSTDSTKVEIQDSALEISCKEKVSIDFVHPSEIDSVKIRNVKERSRGIFDEYDLEGSDCKIKRSHLKLKKKEFVKEDTENVCGGAETVQNTKISPKTSEKLKMFGFKIQNNALTEFESMKSRYLSEVGQYKCNFNHKHDMSTKITKPRIKTAIDFAIEAAVKKRREDKDTKISKKPNAKIDAAEKLAPNSGKSENVTCKLEKSQLKIDKKVEFSKSEKNTLLSDNSVLVPFVEPKETVSDSISEKAITPRKSIEVLQNLITVFENTNASSGNIILPSLSDLGTSLSPDKSNIALNSTLKNISTTEPHNITQTQNNILWNMFADSIYTEIPNNSSLEKNLVVENSDRTLNLSVKVNSSTEKFNTGDNPTEGTWMKTFSPEKQIVVLHETAVIPENSQTCGTTAEIDTEVKKLLAKPSIIFPNSNSMLVETNKNYVLTLEKSDRHQKLQTMECPPADINGPILEKEFLRQALSNNVNSNFESLKFVDLTDEPNERTILTNEIQKIDDCKSILHEKRDLTQKLEELEEAHVIKRHNESKRKRESVVGNERKKAKLQVHKEITKTSDTDVAHEMATKCTKRPRKNFYAKEIEKLQICKSTEIPMKQGRRTKQRNYIKGIQNLTKKNEMCDPLVQKIMEERMQKEIAEKNKTDDEKHKEKNKKHNVSIQCKVKSNSGKKKLKYKTLAEVRHNIHNNTDRIDISKSGKKERKHKKANRNEYQNAQTFFVEDITETQKQKILKQKRKHKRQQLDEPKIEQKKRRIPADEHDFINELDKVNEFYLKDKKKKKHQKAKTLQFPMRTASKLKQSVLNFSPDSKMTLTTSPNDRTVTPHPVSQSKKKKLKDFSPDGLKQTTLNNFFSLHFTLN